MGRYTTERNFEGSRRRGKMSTTKITILAVIALSVIIAIVIGSCSIAPAYRELYEEIEPDETAFVIPLEEGTSAQKQFESVAYLEGKKVAAKRILIPQRLSKQGRWRKNYKYIPTVKVVKVSRVWVSREWTEETETGTTEKKQALRMESKDSIGFKYPCNLTGYVAEADTSLFLYSFGGLPLEEIIDGPIRNDAQSELAMRFGDVNLKDIIASAQGTLNEGAVVSLSAQDISKKKMFEEVLAVLIAKYKLVGITIPTFGPAGQLQYEEDEIQKAINKSFAAEIDVKAAKSEKLAEDTRILMRAAAAKSYEANKDAQEALKRLEIDMQLATAVLEAAKQGTPIVPQYMSGPGGGGMIMQMMQRQAEQ